MRLAIIVVLLSASSAISGKFIKCEDTPRIMNSVAQRLAGTWIVNQPLSGALGFSIYDWTEVTFAENQSTLAEFGQLNSAKDYCVYLVGTMNLIGERRQLMERPFVLTSVNGMPYIVWLKTYGEQGIDRESFQISMLTGADPSKDLLGLGDDHYDSDTPMIIFNRLTT